MTQTTTDPHRVPTTVLFVVMLLGTVGPLATDMYVPSFPHVAAELHVSASSVQLTLTTFFIGMGLGQLIGGPVSDQYGRRRTLLGGSVLLTLASVGCALAPGIGVLATFRLLQGFGGGWAMVIGRAVLVDLAHGPTLVRLLGVIMSISGIAPIIAPLLGGVIQGVWNWRGAFWILTGLGVVMLISAVVWIPESLPPERRHPGGLRSFATGARDVVANRHFVGFLITAAAAFFGMFAYVAASSFVLQTINHFTPMQYSLDFAINAVGLTAATFVGSRLAGRVPTRRVINVGQALALVAGVVMLVNALWFRAAVVPTLLCFFLLTTGQGLVGANSTALGAQEVPRRAGTASALQGLTQSLAASVVAPLTGLGGSTSAVPMAALMVAGPVVSLAALLGLTHGRTQWRRARSDLGINPD